MTVAQRKTQLADMKCWCKHAGSNPAVPFKKGKQVSNKKVIEDTLSFVRQQVLKNQDRLADLVSYSQTDIPEREDEYNRGYLQGEKDLARKVELMLMED